MKSSILGFFLLAFAFFAQAEDLSQLEQKAAEKLTSIYVCKDDAKIEALHLQFKKAMTELVKSDGFFDYKLQQLKIGDLKSGDKTVRVLTWNIEYSDLSYTYGGFILRREEGRDRVVITELIDKTDPYSAKPEGVIDAKNWYGALYFKIIDFSHQGKTEYLLFGYDGATTMSNFKVLDVLSFSGQTPRFGSPVFKDQKVTRKRVVFEYSNMASMSLVFEPKRSRIVADHLSPETPALDGVFSYYFPDLSYDAYVFDYDSELWILHTDVVATNPEDAGEQFFYALNAKTGKAEKNRMQADWVSPSDPENPENGQHKAQLPETTSTQLQQDEFPKTRFRIFKRRYRNPEMLQD
ncbi:MAG: hypothetical protein RLZZ301_1420 [Bacteroidota bacterium]|jgi:hypothetical protein